MSNIENINIDFAFSPLLIILGIILLAGYSYLIYRYTIPPVSKILKYFLLSLRIISLALILTVIFEPIISVKYNEEKEPLTYIFVDESRSIVNEDSTQNADIIKNIVSDVYKNSDNGVRSYSFSKDVDSLAADKINEIGFKGGFTNLNSVINFMHAQKENVSSVIIISDGIITDGDNPEYNAKKLPFPIFTIGIGDTTERNDININKVFRNNYIYVNKPTIINANIINKGYSSKNAVLRLYENNKLVDQKNIELSSSGINNADFEYTPSVPGENKIVIDVSHLEGEVTYANNQKTFFINVLDNKVKVLLIAGAPSEDLSFIKNSLISDNNLEVGSVIQISQNNFLGNGDHYTKIDSADVLFLIGFPSDNTPDDLINKVSESIKIKNKPFFISLAPSVNLQKLKRIESDLPFAISELREEKVLGQPDIIDVNNSLLNNSSADPIAEWNNLPPVSVFNSALNPKPESEIISKVRISNIPVNLPLILTRNAGKSRSLAVTASNIWRWKLQRNQINLFDNFISNSVKWLNTNSNLKYFEVKTSKKIYSQGEQIDFTAQVYDETFNPLDDAEIKIKIQNEDNDFELIFSSAGYGIYEAAYQSNIPGDYKYTGEASIGTKILGTDKGLFSISETDIEKIETKLNKNLLTLIANTTGGKYYNSSDFRQIFEEINNKKYNTVLKKSYIQETNLWSHETLLLLIILLFSLEWFFRKQAGML